MDRSNAPRLLDDAERRGPIAWMTRHSVAPNLLLIFLVLGGVITALRIKQEIFPEFELDLVTATVPYPGASPEEVEQGIILAIEEGIRGIDGVKEVRSVAREGSGTVTAELLPRVNRQRVYQEIQQEVNRITTFPEAAEQPEVVLVTNKRDVMDVILYGDADEWVLRVLAEQIRDRILQGGEVTQIELEPDRIFEVGIEVPQENLRAYNLTLNEIAARIRTASVEIPGGSIRTEAGEILLRMKERRDWAREFEEIPVITAEDGTQLLVRDIAVVRDEFAETYEFLTYNGKPAVNLEIFRIGDQTPVGVSDAVKQKLEEIRPDLPPGVHVDIRRDASDTYRQRLQLLTKNGLMGLFLVLLILTIFLEYKLALWVTVGIVVSFMGAMLFLPSVDVTVNMISMFAFIIALGIVVDNAIVVGENVFEYRHRGRDRLSAAIRGTQEVAVPVTFSILTNIAAFVPLMFIPGTMGKVWRVVPLVVSAVFIVSYIEALLVLPAHLSQMKKDNATRLGRAIHRLQDRMSAFIARSIENLFGPLLDLVLRARYLTVSLSLAVLFVVVGYIASGRLGFQMAPKVEADYSVVSAVLPYGSPLSALEDVSLRLVRAVQEVADENGGLELMRGVRASIRQNQLFVVAYLTDPDVRPLNTFEFTDKWRERVGFISGLESIRFEADRGGPGSGASLTVELAHWDIPTLDHAGTELAEALSQFANVSDVDDGYTPGKQQFDFQMRSEGRSLGLTAAEVARQLRSSFYGAEALRQQRGRNEVKVMVRLPRINRVSMHDLESFIVRTPAGADVPLHQVATVQAGRAYTTIDRRDSRRTIRVTADVRPESETDQVLANLKETVLPKLVRDHPGLSYSFQGKQENMREILVALRQGSVIVLLSIYVLLGIPFRSYFQPLIVMLSIPFGIVGAVLGHLIMGYSLSIISIMGIIALSGVVVNGALILIDYANRQREQGLSAHDAIHAAGVRRFRPIILTTITTFGGLAPMIFESSRQARFMIPMALSLGYGIVFGTAITLLIIPCLYLILDDLHRLVTWNFNEQPETKPERRAGARAGNLEFADS